MNSIVPWKSALSAELRFCLRLTIAGLLAFAIAQSPNIPLHGLWVVLTAIVVTQISVGGSLRATIEYVIGTLGGSVYSRVVGLLGPCTTPLRKRAFSFSRLLPWRLRQRSIRSSAWHRYDPSILGLGRVKTFCREGLG
jgi:Fusaric acid resistance protein-like